MKEKIAKMPIAENLPEGTESMFLKYIYSLG
jgi:hypothetical protein